MEQNRLSSGTAKQLQCNVKSPFLSAIVEREKHSSVFLASSHCDVKVQKKKKKLLFKKRLL